MDGLTLAGTLGLECGPTVALFLFWGKVRKKPCHQAHPKLHEHELDREKKRMNFVLGENLEGLHQTYENQRSAPHSA